MGQKFTNIAKGVSASVTAAAAMSVTLADSSLGVLFPVANTGALADAASFKAASADWFKLVLKDDSGFEICYCGTHAASSATFSDLLRAQEGTTARDFANGHTVALRLTAEDAQGLYDGLATSLQPKPTTLNVQAGTTYNLLLTDAEGMVSMTNAAANSVGVPANADVAYEIGTTIYVLQSDAGQTTLTAGVGVTLNTPTGLKVPGQYQSIGLIKVATDTWNVFGAVA